MSAVPVLIAGTVGTVGQHHQADMWAPQLAGAGLAVESVWTPPTVGDDQLQKARELAEAYGVELQVSPQPQTDAAGAIVCLRGAERIRFAEFAAGRKLPLLIDKPTLDTTAQLEEFAAAAGSLPVMAGHHLLSQPGYTRALRAVRDAEIGLLRAVHVDLVTGGGTAAEVGELRNLGVHTVELIRQLTGPASLGVQAHATSDGTSSTFLGRTDRQVVVSHHVSRTSVAEEPVQQLRAILRVTGTHGFLTVDLTKPALALRTIRGSSAVAYASSITRHLHTFAGVIAGSSRPAPASDFVVLSRALDGIAASASSGRPESITW